MRTAELSRTEFVEWLGSFERGEQAKLPTSGRVGRSEISVVWLNESDTAPCIVVPAADMREFLAFTATYIGTYSPFTAFFRVLPQELMEVIPLHPARNKGFSQHALMGIIIADAARQSDSAKPDVSSVSIQAALATSSACLVQACLLGYNVDLSLVALDRWDTINSEFENGLSRVEAEKLYKFWATALPALGSSGPTFIDPDPLVADLVTEVKNHTSRDGSLLMGVLRDLLPEADQIAPLLTSTREERVRALERLSSQLKKGTLGDFRADAVIGFSISQVADGSLNYLPLALDLSKDFPLAALWFGLFAGLNPKSDVFTAGECLGRHLYHRLKPLEGVFADIDADLGFEEFLLLHSERRTSKLRTQQRNLIQVELIPGVIGRYRTVRPGGMRANPAPNQLNLAQIRRLVEQLHALLTEPEAQTSTSHGRLFDDTEGSSHKNRAYPRRKKK